MASASIQIHVCKDKTTAAKVKKVIKKSHPNGKVKISVRSFDQATLVDSRDFKNEKPLLYEGGTPIIVEAIIT